MINVADGDVESVLWLRSERACFCPRSAGLEADATATPSIGGAALNQFELISRPVPSVNRGGQSLLGAPEQTSKPDQYLALPNRDVGPDGGDGRCCSG